MNAYQKTATNGNNTIACGSGAPDETGGLGAPVSDNSGNHDVLQQHYAEMHELFETINHLKVDNIMHAAALQRTADVHAKRAKEQLNKAKAEAAKLKSKKQSDPKEGLKHLSKFRRPSCESAALCQERL